MYFSGNNQVVNRSKLHIIESSSWTHHPNVKVAHISVNNDTWQYFDLSPIINIACSILNFTLNKDTYIHIFTLFDDVTNSHILLACYAKGD